jgi:septum formation inhibitor-activating ATPase MinD
VLRQQVVTLWGGKPGAGRSTLAVALGDLLARAGDLRVCTVDLNPYNSSLAPLLGREQEASSWLHLSEAMARGLPLPGDALRWIRPNWALVSGPDGRPEWLPQLNPEAIAWLVDGLRTQFDYIILDPEARPGPIRETAVRLAQLVLVTVTGDYPDVLDTARAFEAGLEQGSLDHSRSRLILSRWLESPHLTPADVADCFGLPISLVLPHAPEAVVHASGQGLPVTQVAVKGAEPLQLALSKLVAIVAPAVATVAATAPKAGLGRQLRGWLSR